jgi:hypothetical protein
MPRLSTIGVASAGAFGFGTNALIPIEYLIIAGGGGGTIKVDANSYCGGGGAGGGPMGMPGMMGGFDPKAALAGLRSTKKPAAAEEEKK